MLTNCAIVAMKGTKFSSACAEIQQTWLFTLLSFKLSDHLCIVVDLLSTKMITTPITCSATSGKGKTQFSFLNWGNKQSWRLFCRRNNWWRSAGKKTFISFHTKLSHSGFCFSAKLKEMCCRKLLVVLSFELVLFSKAFCSSQKLETSYLPTWYTR